MVLYFTGTGNSKFIAETIANELGDEILSINEYLKEGKKEIIDVGNRIILVTPTYSWRVPRIVSDWIIKTNFKGSKKIWFVMNCGNDIGNACKYNKKICREKDFKYMGTAEIVMPENYIAMFAIPSKEESRKIIENAKPLIGNIIQQISDEKEFNPPKNNIIRDFMSSVVNRVFYPLCVKAKPFYANNKCIGCGKCEKKCPLNNINLINKKPIWGNNCTHCMACISYCPTEAIEYGRHSVGKRRYNFENSQ